MSHAAIEVTSPRHLFAADAALQGLLQETSALWPGLEATAAGIEGACTVRYAAVAGTDAADHITAVGGVLATWQLIMPQATSDRETKHDEDTGVLMAHHSLRGSVDGRPVTVLATIAGGEPE